MQGEAGGRGMEVRGLERGREGEMCEIMGMREVCDLGRNTDMCL